jgi:predicted amidohydrolase YtcJ
VIRLFVNGTVLTMDPRQPLAQGLAVRDGRILAVDTTDELLQYPEDDSEVVDLGGRTVIPGFVDPHHHFSIGALEVFFADCRDVSDISEVQARLRRAAGSTPAGAWVRGWGYDHHAFPGRRHPTRQDLDEAVPDRPALLMHYSHHQAVVNTAALRVCGIDAATADPAGGEIARDRGGEPAGLLFERAMSMAEARSREYWEDRFGEVAGPASVRCAAQGITALEDAAVTPAMARRYAEARGAGALAIHVGEMMVGSRGWFEPPDDPAAGATLKLFVDGGYRCALRLQRAGREVTSGVLFYHRPDLADRLVRAWRQGWRVTCHAIGNVGVETAVGAIEDALRLEPSGRGRVRIDHAMFLTPDLIARLADLGVWVVTQPSFLYDAGGASIQHGLRFRPFGTLERAGVHQAFSSDYPCGSLAPLAGIYAAVARRTRTGEVVDPDEAVGIRAALEAYTIRAARAAGIDRERGSLEPSKIADFLMLSSNPLDCRPEDLGAVRVLETWAGGARIAPNLADPP